LWLLGYPEAALADIDHALRDAREIGQAATLMFALGNTTFSHFFCGNYAGASAKSDEIVALADQKGRVVLEGSRNDERRLRIGPNRQSRGRSSHDHLRHHGKTASGINDIFAFCVVTLGYRACGTGPV
jgi:hypothetical protein